MVSGMSTVPSQSENLSDIVSHYGHVDSLPPVDWLTRLERPVASLHGLGKRTRTMKRVIDVIGAGSLLIVLAPLMMLVALLVKVSSPGPMFYRQVRTGLNLRRDRERRDGSRSTTTSEKRANFCDRRMAQAYGKPFVLYKFRTMRTDAERDGAKFAVKGDPRVTRLGRFLRRMRIDELPQLWNVLRGEMSLVGPRPERPEFIDQLSREIPDYLIRLGMKPGLTGLAQVLNGYENEVEGFRRKVAMDLLYLQNCCLWNDVKILLRTVEVVLTGKGAL